jgi:hypothetical protein
VVARRTFWPPPHAPARQPRADPHSRPLPAAPPHAPRLKAHRPGGFTSQLLRGGGLRAPLLVKGDVSGLIPPLGICLPEDYDIERRATDASENDERAVRARACACAAPGPGAVGAGPLSHGPLHASQAGFRRGCASTASFARPPPRKCTYTHTHTHTHARKHTHASTHTRAHTHTHTRARVRTHNVARQVFTWDVATQDYGPAWSVAQWALYWRVRKGFADKPTAQDCAVGAPPGGGDDSSDDGFEEVDSTFVKRRWGCRGGRGLHGVIGSGLLHGGPQEGRGPRRRRGTRRARTRAPPRPRRARRGAGRRRGGCSGAGAWRGAMLCLRQERAAVLWYI